MSLRKPYIMTKKNKKQLLDDIEESAVSLSKRDRNSFGSALIAASIFHLAQVIEGFKENVVVTIPDEIVTDKAFKINLPDNINAAVPSVNDKPTSETPPTNSTAEIALLRSRAVARLEKLGVPDSLITDVLEMVDEDGDYSRTYRYVTTVSLSQLLEQLESGYNWTPATVYEEEEVEEGAAVLLKDPNTVFAVSGDSKFPAIIEYIIMRLQLGDILRRSFYGQPYIRELKTNSTVNISDYALNFMITEGLIDSRTLYLTPKGSDVPVNSSDLFTEQFEGKVLT